MSCWSFSHHVSACNGAKQWGTLWSPQKEMIYRAVQVNNKVLCTCHLSLSGCNPWKFKTPLCITLPQHQELDTTHLLFQPLQEKTPHCPCSLGVPSWSFSPLLGNCWQPHLWESCSTAPITKDLITAVESYPYRPRWHDLYSTNSSSYFHSPKVPKIIILQCMQ